MLFALLAALMDFATPRHHQPRSNDVPCTPQAIALPLADSVMSGVSGRGSDVIVLVRRGDTNRLLHLDLCGGTPPRELLTGDAKLLTSVPFMLSDTLLLIVEHSQRRGFLIDLSKRTVQEQWFPSRYDPNAPIPLVIGGVVAGRLAWRVNSLKDSLPPMPAFKDPWLLGKSLLDPDQELPELALPLPTGVLATSRGDDLWTIRHGRWLTRTRTSGSRVVQSDSTAIPIVAARVIATPDGRVWAGTPTKGMPGRWTVYDPEIGSFHGCVDISERVITAVSARELLIERRAPDGAASLVIVQVAPTKDAC